MSPLHRAVLAEAIGSALLACIVVGSGIMAERLSENAGVALLANALATGAGLFALIHTFGPVSGAHFNPVVTLATAYVGDTPRDRIVPFVLAQVFGMVGGVLLANGMFGLDAAMLSEHRRGSPALWVSEILATFGLLTILLGVSKSAPKAVPACVAAYIVAAYWFTPSTSFANPAITLARGLTDTFAGIAPADVPAFVLAQLLGATLATVLVPTLFHKESTA